MADELPPSILYKYQSFDRDRLRQTLTNSRIWFGSPLAFDDPFDCFPIIDLSGSDDEFIQLATSVLKNQQDGLTADEKRDFIDEIVKRRGRHKITTEQGNEAWRMSANDLGVLCLTERPDDQLMWGHYASSHTGICLGFDTRARLFNLARKVQYTDKRPAFRVLERGEKKLDMIFSALGSKAEHWAYEREWRLYIPGQVGLVEFEPEALKVVVVGALAKKEDEDWLLGELRSRHNPVSLLKCRLSPERYQLEAVRINYQG